MIHYIYKTFTDSGKFYIGRHSTKNLDDGYFGSGKWVRSIKDRSILNKEILEYCDSHEKLIERETYYLSLYLGSDNCMNFNNSPVGFGSGDFNPNRDPKQRERLSKAISGENNPMANNEIKAKAFKSKKEFYAANPGFNSRPHTEESKKKMSVVRNGLKFSDEGRKKLSESRKRQYELGERILPSFKGRTQTDDSKKKMSSSHLKTEKIECSHCMKLIDPGNYKRWHGDKCKMM